MAVVLLLASGEQRNIEHADGARLDPPFFMVTRRHRRTGEVETVLTLRAEAVFAAEVLHDGVRTDYVLGLGHHPSKGKA